MEISQIGVDLIKEFEGLELEAYTDVAGIWTIGHGHIDNVKAGDKITEAEAEEILREDLKRFVAGVNKTVKTTVTQNQFDALVSLAFNIGVGAFSGSTALRLLNKEDYIGAAEAITWWNKATINGIKQEVAGLVRRRAAEAALFLKDVSVNGDLIKEDYQESTRVTPEENLPRRGHLGQSRTMEGAAMAGAAGAAGIGATIMPDNNDQETLIASPPGGEAAPSSVGKASTSEISCMTAEDLANMRDGEIEIPEGTPLCSEIAQPPAPAPEAAPSVSTDQIADTIQLIAFGIVIVMVIYIMYARFDDWRKFRR